jgi:hypothetical protein
VRSTRAVASAALCCLLRRGIPYEMPRSFRCFFFFFCVSFRVIICLSFNFCLVSILFNSLLPHPNPNFARSASVQVDSSTVSRAQQSRLEKESKEVPRVLPSEVKKPADMPVRASTLAGT